MHTFLLSLCLLSLLPAFAQEKLLTLDEAIKLTLERNPDIKIEKLQATIAENNVSRGLAGQLPNLQLGASYQFGYADAEFETLPLIEGTTPRPISLDGINREFGVDLTLSINLFSGFQSKYRYQQLSTLGKIGQAQLIAKIESTLLDVYFSYLKVSELQIQQRLAIENLKLSESIYQKAKESEIFGVSAALRTLQSEVDLKMDSTSYLIITRDLENAKRALMLLLNQSYENLDFMVEEIIRYQNDLSLLELKQSMFEKNTTLKLAQYGVIHAEKGLEQTKSRWFPTLQAYASGQYFNNQNDANFLQSNVSFGPHVGVRLSYPLYNGKTAQIQQQNMELHLAQQLTSREFLESKMLSELLNSYSNYRSDLDILNRENSNLETFQLNYEKTKNDFNQGVADGIALRLAQLNLNQLKNRINSLAFQVKRSEIILLLTAGILFE